MEHFTGEKGGADLADLGLQWLYETDAVSREEGYREGQQAELAWLNLLNTLLGARR